MPFIKTYDASVTPGGEIPSGRAPNLGDGGVGALAKGFSNLGANIYRRDLEKDDADAVAETARLRSELAERRQAAALNGEAADPEWVAKEREYTQERLGTLSGNMRTNDGRRATQMRTAQLLADENGRWLATQASVSANLQKNQLRDVEDLTLRTVQKDPTTHGESVTGFIADLDGPAYSQLSKDVKEDYARQFRINAARAMLTGTEERYGSQAALKALEGLRDEMPADQYTAFRDHFANRAKQEAAQDREVEQGRLLRTIRQTMTSGGDPSPLIDAGLKNKLLSGEQYASQLAQYDAYVDHRRKVATASEAFRAGNLVNFEAVEPTIRKEVADTWWAEKTAQYKNASPDGKAAIANDIASKGVEMDYVFAGLKTSLRATPHGEGFSAAVDLYRSLEAFDPYYASKYVSEDQRARFEVYTNSMRGGAAPDQALVFAQNVTPETIAKTRKLFTGDGRKSAADIQARLEDKPWSLASMMNGRQAADAVMDRVVTQLAGNPSLDVETAIDSAIEIYESQNVPVGSLWVPRSFLSGVPARRMADVADRLATRIPDVLREDKIPVMEGKYSLAPDYGSDRDGLLQVYDPLGNPLPGMRFGPKHFKRQYEMMQGEEYDKLRSGEKPGRLQSQMQDARKRFANPRVE